MPNQWTRRTQAIQEAINGPRTKDVEFTKLTNKMKVIESGVLTLRSIIQTIESSTQSLCSLFKQLSDVIKKIYDTSSPFYQITHDIKNAHESMVHDYDEFKKSILSLSSKTSEWSVLFSQVQEQIKQRDDKQKVYDHYEQKLDKLYETNASKKNKSKKEEEHIERNEEKYKKAAEEYAEASEKSFINITNILDKRYDIINPVFADLIKNELKFFQSITIALSKFEDIDDIFAKIKAELSTNYKYDPWKCIKGRDYLKKVSFRKSIGTGRKSNETQDEEIIKTSFPKLSQKVYDDFSKIEDDLNNSNEITKEEDN